jgi:hypothetical protein
VPGGGCAGGGSTVGGSTVGGSTDGGSTVGGSTVGGSTVGGSTVGVVTGGVVTGGVVTGGVVTGGVVAGGVVAGGVVAGGAGGSAVGVSTAAARAAPSASARRACQFASTIAHAAAAASIIATRIVKCSRTRIGTPPTERSKRAPTDGFDDGAVPSIADDRAGRAPLQEELCASRVTRSSARCYDAHRDVSTRTTAWRMLQQAVRAHATCRRQLLQFFTDDTSVWCRRIARTWLRSESPAPGGALRTTRAEQRHRRGRAFPARRVCENRA